MLNRVKYQYIGELHSFTTADGTTLNLSGDVYLTTFGGFGLADFEYQTRNGYKQDGSSEIDFRANDRTFSVNVYREGLKNRDDYWTERLALINIFRPNRGGLLTMTVLQKNGEKRSILCRLQAGLEFSQESANGNNWDFNLNLSLVAFNPTWFDASATVFSPSAISDEQLVFPVTFDDINQIVFGSSGQVYTTGEIIYNGNWRTYPVMTITGPYSSCTLTNTATDVQIQLLTPISTGEQRIISTVPGDIYVIDENGDSAFNELEKGSNFVDFAIFPLSELATLAPAQAIQANLVGATVGQSAFSVTYNERYIGI
jgi:hypothetical protein